MIWLTVKGQADAFLEQRERHDSSRPTRETNLIFLNVVQTRMTHERNPYSPIFEDLSAGWTGHLENEALKAAWTLSKEIYKRLDASRDVRHRFLQIESFHTFHAESIKNSKSSRVHCGQRRFASYDVWELTHIRWLKYDDVYNQTLLHPDCSRSRGCWTLTSRSSTG